MRSTTSATLAVDHPPRMHAGAGPTVLQRLARGEAEAMQACMETYGGLVLSLARRQLGATGDVDDGVQEVFLALWQSAGRFDPARGSEPAFVATLAQRKLIDHRRRNAAQRRIAIKPYATGRRSIPAHAPVDHDLREEAKRADDVLRQLPGDVQHTLALSLYRGLSYTSIATAVGAPNGTIKSWASRGLQRMREKLQPMVCEPTPALAEVA
jgi:RNA polymerase sigma-70 factor (ECF subfamily)